MFFNLLKLRFKSFLTFLGQSSPKIETAQPAEKSFTNTILLPKTEFPALPKNVVERDKLMIKEAKFSELYEWQRKHKKGREFVLHDGPPYANGDLHMGHALNKILKDIYLRYNLLKGSKVHFVPGWDCHGLPIELIALKQEKEALDTVQIRRKCRDLASSQVDQQKEVFSNWGVLANWENNFYCTYNTDYIVNELLMFWKLYNNGYIYYGLKPVYWSPSSKTALAEAELDYNPNHISKSVTVRFEIVGESGDEPTYLVIWTTTPWTLPLNKAVYFSNELSYSLVNISSLSGQYILGSSLIEDLQKKLNKTITVIRSVSHEELLKMKYYHPWRKEETLQVRSSPSVEDKATGLLHSAPSHGHEDFLLGLRDGLLVECMVDDSGCFTADVGPELSGLEVLGEGSNRVIEKLNSDILLKEDFKHKYPYDWRTKKPVIVRASNQWFIDTDKLKSKAIKSLSNVSVPVDYFKQNLEKRPYWCISRQRVWGVPIPFFIHEKSGRVLLSRNLIHHFCLLIEKNGPDSWWTLKKEELFPDQLCKEFGVELEEVRRGNDILDIWFDSGVSWSHVLEGRESDLLIEGVDQIGGWFQSSLFTSVAAHGNAPYKKFNIHGFTVDENGKKMSKSLGNVVDPKMITEGAKAFGVDTLRWWTASHGHQITVPVSQNILKNDFNEVKKLRLAMKFFLGALNTVKKEDLENASITYHLDRYILKSCYNLYSDVMKSYENYDLYTVSGDIRNFVTSTVSAFYLGSVKDRLYCDSARTERRLSCVKTLSALLDTLSYCVAPILPHLIEETNKFNPLTEELFFYNENQWRPPDSWSTIADSSTEVIELAKNWRKEVEKVAAKTANLSCSIQCNENDYQLLNKLTNGPDPNLDCELTEILQVSSVKLTIGEKNFEASETKLNQCPRCRRYISVNGELCPRCEKVMLSVSHP